MKYIRLLIKNKIENALYCLYKMVFTISNDLSLLQVL